MSFSPKPFGKGNPCPICGKDDASCRYNPADISFILCHTYVDAREKEVINGFICVKASNGHTSSFKPYTGDLSEEAKREYETKRLQEQQLRQKKQQAEREARQKRSLSSLERHELYSEILNELTLDAATIADLEQRGFTKDQIQASGFKSIQRGQKLSKKYPVNLPGIGESGDTFIVGGGYLQPIINHEGLIVGMQLRFHNPKDGNKHCWLSSHAEPVHTKEYNELPIVVRIPSELKSFDIQIVEGTGSKPLLAAERMGMVTIGAAGGNHISSPETLKATIKAVQSALCQVAQENGLTLTKPNPLGVKLKKSKETLPPSGKQLEENQILHVSESPNTQNDYLVSQLRNSLANTQRLKNSISTCSSFVISPDAGFALNPSVIKTLLKTTEWLQKNFINTQIYFHDWNQIHKSQGDIDELLDLSIVRKLRLESFFRKYKEVINAEKGFANKRFQEWATRRIKLTADIVQHEKWLSIPQDIQNECDILLIRKSLGGGKTQALIEFLKSVSAISSCSDVTSLLVGYRNTLLQNTIERANKLGLPAMHIRDAKELAGGSVINFAADDSIKLWGGCADSFFKFNAVISHNPNYYLIHDEICSVLGHLKGGGTLKGRQQQAIEWDVNTIRNSKFAIMMDANLSDREVDFMRQLFPEKRIKVLDSVSPRTPRTFIFLETESSTSDYSRNAQYLPSQLIEKAKQFNRVAWLSDSQRSCEVADEILTKHGHKHYRLDGKTSHDELAKQFQSDPVKFITTENLDSVSISPSGESGLSIDLFNYFDAVCLDIKGTVSVNTLTQLSARLRDTNVPIYVSCPEFVNLTSDPCPYAIKKVEDVLNQRIDLLLAKAMEVDGELVNSEFVTDMFAEMGKKFAADPWFIESLKDAKELKYEHSNLKLALKTALAQAGHRVIDLAEGMDEEIYNEVQETKEIVKRREAEKIFNSEDITWEQAQELSKKDVDYETKCKIRKARLKHQLPGIEETPSWGVDFIYTVLLDETKFLDARWRLKQFENEELFKAVFKTEKRYNFEFGFTPNEAWKSTSTKIEALKLLGVGKIIDTGLFSSQDSWVQEIVNEYYINPEWFDLIGIPRANQTFRDDGSLKNLQYVKKTVDRFLEFFGLECEQSDRTRSNGRLYTVTTPEALENYLPDIDECLDTRAKAILEEAQKLSLKEAADKAQERQRQQREWEEKHQTELNKRMLESQLTHTHSAVTPSSSIYINQKEKVSRTEVLNISTTEIKEWNQPETIADVARMLEDCENSGMLAMLRQCNIPAEVFRIAARHLPSDKREQIREWVIIQNNLPEPLVGF